MKLAVDGSEFCEAINELRLIVMRGSDNARRTAEYVVENYTLDELAVFSDGVLIDGEVVIKVLPSETLAQIVRELKARP